MKSDEAIYIKVPTALKIHVNQYVKDKKVKGGVSGLLKRYMERRTGFKPDAE